jgi:hypothetical protein
MVHISAESASQIIETRVYGQRPADDILDTWLAPDIAATRQARGFTIQERPQFVAAGIWPIGQPAREAAMRFMPE